MRYQEITELAGVKQFAKMTATEIIEFIQAKLGHGPIKVLGQGASGAALIVGNNVYKMWLLDSAYTDFVNYCQAHSNNPFLPKFLTGIKKMPAFFIRHEEAPDFVNYVRMEKLRPMGSRALNYQFELNVTLDPEDYDELGHLTNVSLGQITAFITNTPDSEIPPLTLFLTKFSSYRSYQYTKEMIPDDLVLFIETLFAMKSMTSHKLDLHQENFMMRGDQLVILDPIANKDDLSLNLSFEKFDNKLSRDETEGKKAASAATRKSNTTNQKT